MFERQHHLHQGVQQHQHGRVSGEVRNVRSVHLLDLVVGPGKVSALHKLHRTCWRLSGVWEWSQVMWRRGEVSVHHLWRSQQAKWYSDTKWSHGRLSKWTLSSTCLPKSYSDAKTQVTIYRIELLKWFMIYSLDGVTYQPSLSLYSLSVVEAPTRMEFMLPMPPVICSAWIPSNGRAWRTCRSQDIRWSHNCRGHNIICCYTGCWYWSSG